MSEIPYFSFKVVSLLCSFSVDYKYKTTLNKKIKVEHIKLEISPSLSYHIIYKSRKLE